MMAPYTSEYYARLGPGSRASAEAVVPLVVQLVQPRSVIDVGCGTGAWLSIFKRHDVVDVRGVDGSHIDVARLELEPREFLAADLTQPLSVGRQFDLAVSLEVAEHLPASVADQFVNSLATLAPIVLFSAAVPDQGGECHLNEQWPAYWTRRFQARDFVALDPFRRLLWQRQDVDWWYAQNLLLFVRRDQLPKYPSLISKTDDAIEHQEILPLIHPGNYRQHAWRNRVLHLAVDLASIVPVGERLILVDDNCFGTLYLPGRDILPFLERDKTYAGPPRDDEQAISELHRMQSAGSTFIAFGWPSFWWLTHYRKLADHLERHGTHVLRNDRLVLFSLRRER